MHARQPSYQCFSYTHPPIYPPHTHKTRDRNHFSFHQFILWGLTSAWAAIVHGSWPMGDARNSCPLLGVPGKVFKPQINPFAFWKLCMFASSSMSFWVYVAFYENRGDTEYTNCKAQYLVYKCTASVILFNLLFSTDYDGEIYSISHKRRT